MPRKTVKLALSTSLVVVVGAGGAWAWAQSGGSAAAPTYLTAPATRGTVTATISATGFVEPQSQVALAFKNAGRVSAVLAAPGQAVKAGEILATQDREDLEAQVAQATANLKAAQARLDGLVAGARQEDLAVSLAAVESARINLESARINLANAEEKARLDLENTTRSLSLTEETVAANRLTYEEDLRLFALADTAYQEALADQDRIQEAYNATKAEILLTQQGLAAANQAYSEASAAYGPRSPRGVEAAEALGKVQGELDQLNLLLTDLQFQLDAARTSTAQKQSDYTYRQNLVNQSQSRVDSDKSLLEKERAGALIMPVTTGQSVDSARNQVAQAEAALATAQANYAKVLAGASDPDIRAASAAVEQADASVRLAQNNLTGASLAAPFDGVVASVSLSPGQLVGSGGSGGSIVLISEALRVTAQVNEADIAKALVGQRATFTANAYLNRSFAGEVLSIAPLASTVSSVQLFDVTLSLENPPPTMKAGLPLTVQIVVSERSDVMTVPRSAVSYAQAYTATQNALKPAAEATPAPQQSGSGTPGSGTPGSGTPGSGAGKGTGVPGTGTQNKAPSIILVQESSGKVVPVTVQLGLSDARNYEVLSGMTEGALVITGVRPTTSTKSSTSSSLIPVTTSGTGGGGGR